MSLETAKRRYFVQYQSEFSAQRDAILELLKKSPNDTEGLSKLTRSIQNEIAQTLTNEFGHEVAQETAGVIVHEYLIPQAKADVPRMSRIFHPGYFYVLGILLIVGGFLAYVFTIGTPAGESFLALAFVGIVCVVIATYLSKGKTDKDKH